VPMGSLPKNTNGKTQRREVARLALKQQPISQLSPTGE